MGMIFNIGLMPWPACIGLAPPVHQSHTRNLSSSTTCASTTFVQNVSRLLPSIYAASHSITLSELAWTVQTLVTLRPTGSINWYH
jgi:hypothetical protein